ncbi:hypothetical protein ACHAXT_012937 [Thalassiosira profunda]
MFARRNKSGVRWAFLAVGSYWAFFFGAELCRTVRLYQNRCSDCHALNASEQAEDDRDTSTHLPLAEDTRENGTHRVPLIMHRMWKDDAFLENSSPALPTNWTKAFADCNEQYRKRNWTTILWSDESLRSFFEDHYQDFLPTYDSYRYNIQRVDAARYFVLFHFGGLYMDLDVGCRPSKDLGDLIHSMERLQKVAAIPQTQPFGFSNDVLISAKGSSFFKALIDALPSKTRWYCSPYLSVMYSTGPMFLSLQYARLPPAKQHDVLVLPPELYTERKTRYFKHLRGSTWHQSDAHAVRWVMTHKLVVAGALALVVVACITIRRMPQKKESKRV